MHRFALIAAICTGLAGCNGINQQNADEATAGAVIGGITGAVVGEDKNRERNVILGAAAGAAVGAAIGDNNTCTYRNTRTGERFTAPCGSY